jgi:hypothetical protein
MYKLLFASLLGCTLVYSCKSKKEGEEPTNYFPVLSFLKSQVTNVDTSLYQIIKIQKEKNSKPTQKTSFPYLIYHQMI